MALGNPRAAHTTKPARAFERFLGANNRRHLKGRLDAQSTSHEGAGAGAAPVAEMAAVVAGTGNARLHSQERRALVGTELLLGRLSLAGPEASATCDGSNGGTETRG